MVVVGRGRKRNFDVEKEEIKIGMRVQKNRERKFTDY